MLIKHYPNVTVTEYLGFGFTEFLFSDGVKRTHQYTCPIDCHQYGGGCKWDGNPKLCFKGIVNIQDFPQDNSKGHRGCIFCGNDKCATCGDNFSNFQ